ncbi:type II secretion system protein N [Hahella ganghwensis]|uniref:type II secretion system protein N n=1 Tax=Hahella ganghwensis TaxID=286420 RepID=UPI0012F94DA9|nr:type II secretion system protein N [Hahella ganghwensis]
MILKSVAMFVIAGLSYFIALVLYMPVSFAWGYVQEWLPLQQLPVKVQQTNGTLWDGEALLSSRQLSGVIDWQLAPQSLITSDSLVNIDFRSDRISLTSQGALRNFEQAELDANLELDLAALNPLLRQHRLNLSGVLTIQRLSTVVDLNTGKPLELKGQGRWEGGSVSYPMGREVQSTVMPPLVGQITQVGQDISLEVTEEESGKAVMQAQMGPDGVAKIQIRRRLLDLAGAPWSGSSGPDDVVFRIQQKVI